MDTIHSAYKKILFLYLILTISIINVSAYQEQDHQSSLEINNVIKKYLETKEKKRKTPLDINTIIKGDVNNDGAEDQIVNYSLNIGYPGNLSVLYIAIFLNINGKLRFNTEVNAGSFGTAIGEITGVDKIEKGIIHCKTYEYSPSDGPCCPSIQKTYKYKLINRKLKQIKD